MNDHVRLLYLNLPGPFRSIAASLYGYRLRSWRYGRETEHLVEEALERERWSREKWKAWQEEQLSYVLNRAAKRVPYYREQWAERRRRGDRSSWDYLENWPLLTKESVRVNQERFLADDCSPSKMFHDHTGGTTGTPLSLWVSKKALRAWHAIFEARARGWNDVTRWQNWATLGGQTVVAAGATTPPFWVWNRPMNHLYLSANHVSRDNTPHYLRALKKYKITHMLAYSSSVSVLAEEAMALGFSIPGIKLIITMAEPLNPRQRDIVKNVFKCDVRETYGMSELVAMATECSFAKLHLWPEVGFLEVMDDVETQLVKARECGRFVCTSLLNTDMPLIRYIVGDRGRIHTDSDICDCGRALPVLSAIEGRTNDLLLTRDGRRVYWINPIFYGLPLREPQAGLSSTTPAPNPAHRIGPS